MAHTGYTKKLSEEVTAQSTIEHRNFKNIKTTGLDGGLGFQERIKNTMISVIADLATRTGGAAKIALIEGDQDAAGTTDGGNGLDNFEDSIKELIKAKKFTGCIRNAHVNKGYYWATGEKLYRFQNRNEFDTYQKLLGAKLAEDLISDLSDSSNRSIESKIKSSKTQIENLSAKSRAAVTNYEVQLAAIITGVSA